MSHKHEKEEGHLSHAVPASIGKKPKGGDGSYLSLNTVEFEVHKTDVVKGDGVVGLIPGSDDLTSLLEKRAGEKNKQHKKRLKALGEVISNILR